MAETTDIVIVKKEHIERGIKKYQGVIDTHLKNLITNAGYEYTPYVFDDGRVLLVLPNNISALLYPTLEILYKKMILE